jgi:hypothetical protein
MNNYKNCLKIESTFPEDDLLIPQKGEISLEINENSGILKLKFINKKHFFDSQIEHKVIEKKVIKY